MDGPMVARVPCNRLAAATTTTSSPNLSIILVYVYMDRSAGYD